MSNRAPKILLLDSNALIHRSYHALPPLTSPKGEQVNAVYGFAAALLKAIHDEKPEYVVACFDASRETFRNEIFAGYKAHRQETDEALSAQIPRTKDIIEVLSIPLFAQKGVEADDLIGSLATIAAQKGLLSVIVTGDNDALQLVDDATSVYSLRRGVTDTLSYNRELVKEKLGVYPEQVVDYKALAGDASDNIPGAPGIGPKTASELLTKYQTLDGIYQHLDELKDRLRTILTDNKEQVLMSKRLAKIRTDLKIDLNLKEAAVTNFDFSKVVSLFHELGFKSLLSKLPQGATPSQSSLFSQEQPKVLEKVAATLPFEAVTTVDRAKELLALLAKQTHIVIDTETIDLDGELIGISFGWAKEATAYLPIAPAYPDGLPLDELRHDLKAVLGNAEIRKIGHNLKYDLGVLARAGLPVEGVWFDTMIASQLINSQLFSHKLDDIAFAELGFRKIPISQLIGTKKDASMATVPLEELAAYACEDAVITWRLYEHFQPDLEETHLKRIFYEIEMPLMPILEKMESAGIAIDASYLKELGDKLKKRLTEIEKKAWQLVGREFNLASPAQLKEILFTQLKLPVIGIKKVQSGYSTDAEALAKLNGRHPIIALLVEYRELAKLISTYIDTLPRQADQNGRVHTSYQQIGAATGRLSSTNPNLQNIPIRTELGTAVRRAFVAGSKKVLLGVDYSQIELRILAHVSEDPKLIAAFQAGDDFHAQVARELGVDRRLAKAINFGIIYGLGAVALAQDADITPEEARQFINRYFTTFPGVANYIEKTKALARSQGFVSTLFGRRRYLPDIHSPNQMLRSGAERMAVNMPCQGTVADLVKLAMIRVNRESLVGAQLLLQIHDELLFEVDPSEITTIAPKIRQLLNTVIELKVPLEVDIKTGPNWADMKPLANVDQR